MEKHIQIACKDDLGEILDLQKQSFYLVSLLINDPNIQPMVQTYEELLQEFEKGIILKYTHNNKIRGSVRAFLDENICHIGKLIVHPDYQNQGLGRLLMSEIENIYNRCHKYVLFTGEITPNTFHLYSLLGYKEVERSHGMITMEKM